MAVSNLIERLGRAIFEAPFGGQKISKDAPELAEIRLAVLDAVKEKAHRAGGKIVFPYNLIRLHLLGVPADQAPVFRSAFLSTYFAEELRNGLTRSSYRFPADLAVDVSTTEAMPGPNESWLRVEALLEEEKPQTIARFDRLGQLSVVTGRAEPSVLKLEKPWINIGRTRDAVQANGPTRRNDIAFSEEDSAGKTVSRQHAHIERDATTGQYRLFNDRVYKGAENCGVYLMRGGSSQAVHRGGHGTLLQPGDEIHLAQAVLRFDPAGFIDSEHQPDSTQ
jgi:hypothetical protein